MAQIRHNLADNSRFQIKHNSLILDSKADKCQIEHSYLIWKMCGVVFVSPELVLCLYLQNCINTCISRIVSIHLEWWVFITLRWPGCFTHVINVKALEPTQYIAFGGELKARHRRPFSANILIEFHMRLSCWGNYGWLNFLAYMRIDS